MMRMLAAAILLAGLLVLNGCYAAPVKPPIGAIYSNIQAPLDIDYAKTAVAAKKGVARSESVLGAVAWGDASTQAAARAGGIQNIEYADYTFFNVLGAYQKFETVVYGN